MRRISTQQDMHNPYAYPCMCGWTDRFGFLRYRKIYGPIYDLIHLLKAIIPTHTRSITPDRDSCTGAWCWLAQNSWKTKLIWPTLKYTHTKHVSALENKRVSVGQTVWCHCRNKGQDEKFQTWYCNLTQTTRADCPQQNHKTAPPYTQLYITETA